MPADSSTEFVRITPRGAGLGYRREMHEALVDHIDDIDVVEILADQWLGDGRLRRLREVTQVFPTVVHGVGLSVAGAGRIPEDYLTAVREVTKACAASFYGEHLAMTYVPGLDSGHLCPPIISDESLRTCIRNVDRTQSALDLPLALENISYSLSPGSDHLAAATFFSDLVAATGCLVLLDVTNLYINAKNHGFDPMEYLKRIPMDRVVQIHLAGGVVLPSGKHIDSHSATIGAGIWQLAVDVATLCRPSAVIVERDQNLDDIDTLVREVSMSRDIYFREA
ncbi:DUF692 domain-containing protein [Streptomyces bauhiniae]|uniref:DUF692 domain-containing protein n=1 Tax=Streptomyces bauhiniae TaxID=2340725 RepID=UPI0033A73A38